MEGVEMELGVPVFTGVWDGLIGVKGVNVGSAGGSTNVRATAVKVPGASTVGETRLFGLQPARQKVTSKHKLMNSFEIDLMLSSDCFQFWMVP